MAPRPRANACGTGGADVVGQGSPSGQPYGAFAFWIGVLIAAAVLIVYVIVALKRRMFRDDSATSAPWTLRQLDAMHERGELTDQQHAKLRAVVISEVKGTPLRPTADSSRTDENNEGQAGCDADTAS